MLLTGHPGNGLFQTAYSIITGCSIVARLCQTLLMC
jgi:hypothetical protein